MARPQAFVFAWYEGQVMRLYHALGMRLYDGLGNFAAYKNNFGGQLTP